MPQPDGAIEMVRVAEAERALIRAVGSSMCGDALAATSNEAVKPPIAPDANR